MNVLLMAVMVASTVALQVKNQNLIPLTNDIVANPEGNEEEHGNTTMAQLQEQFQGEKPPKQTKAQKQAGEEYLYEMTKPRPFDGFYNPNLSKNLLEEATTGNSSLLEAMMTGNSSLLEAMTGNSSLLDVWTTTGIRQGHGYIGCYTDDGHRDLFDGPKRYGYKPDTCAAACANYKYFALQNGGWCVCGNAYATEPKYRKVGDSECRSGQGGPWRNAVYSVGGGAKTNNILTPTQQRNLKKWIEKTIFAMEQRSCKRHSWGKPAAYFTNTWPWEGCRCCGDCNCIYPLCHYGCNGNSDDGTRCWENCKFGIHTDQCPGSNSYCGRAGFRECHHIILDQVVSIVSMISNFIPGGKVLGAMKKSFKAAKGLKGSFTAGAKAAMKTYIRKQGKKLRDKAKKNLKKYVKKELKPQLKSTLQAAVTDAYASEQIDEAIDAVLLKKAARETDFGQEFADLAAAVDPTGIADVVEAFNYPNCRDLWPPLRL